MGRDQLITGQERSFNAANVRQQSKVNSGGSKDRATGGVGAMVLEVALVSFYSVIRDVFERADGPYRRGSVYQICTRGLTRRERPSEQMVWAKPRSCII